MEKFYIIVVIFMIVTSVFLQPSIAKAPMRSNHLPIDQELTVIEEPSANNTYEKTASTISWWNSNWHYRRVYNITGTGNVSLSINFTALLASLQVVNKTFENATIAIIQHNLNGTTLVINTTWFNESHLFHNRTNALGILTWRVTKSALYSVYFDVRENRGTRSLMVETLNLTQSGSIVATLVSTQGWWQEFIYSFETYYPLGSTLLIEVFTTAQAKNATANFFFEGQLNFTMPLTTMNNLFWSNTTKTFSKKGNWSVRVISFDDAGYQAAPLTASFYIGQPDLILSALILPSVCYIKTNVTISAYVLAKNATVHYVNVSLYIDNNLNHTHNNLTFQKNENRTIQFFWLPSTKGIHNVSVIISYADSNPGNNKKWKQVTVEGVPDLGILNISVSPTPVDEGDPVTITAYVRNIGDGNASEYTIILYCEQDANNQTMLYSDERNQTKISLKKNEFKNISLTWDYALYGKADFRGEWAVGIQIRITPQNPDKNSGDNLRALYHALRVTPAERIPPVLSNLEFPTIQELGTPMYISVKATDASGIASVVISLKTPNRTFVNTTMTAKENNRYEYLFTPTQLGRHDFSLTATDLSPSKNQSTVHGHFEVVPERTPPTVSYVGAIPFVQKPGGFVEIRCIATDVSGIKSVTVNVGTPSDQYGHMEIHVMSNTSSDSKYTYTASYGSVGKYVFYITVEDNKGNTKTTDEKTFWIANDLNDTDSDGMPDAWEEKYGFNPYDPTDASQDADDDGITNIQEYQEGTNPLKKLSSSTELISRLKDNWAYLTASLLVLAIILVLVWYGIRRRKP